MQSSPIKLIAFDVDGVLTDGKITYTSSGDEVLSFHVHDGAAIKRLRAAGVEVAFISGRRSPMVDRRAQELGVDRNHQRVVDKLATFNSMLDDLGLKPDQCAYVGDDHPDLPVLRWVGLPIAVANAQPEVRAAAKLVTKCSGGQGVAAEIFRLLQQEGLVTT